MLRTFLFDHFPRFLFLPITVTIPRKKKEDEKMGGKARRGRRALHTQKPRRKEIIGLGILSLLPFFGPGFPPSLLSRCEGFSSPLETGVLPLPCTPHKLASSNTIIAVPQAVANVAKQKKGENYKDCAFDLRAEEGKVG